MTDLNTITYAGGLGAIFKSLIAGKSTTEIGQIVSYQPEAKPPTVSIRPCRMLTRQDGSVSEIQQIDDIPVSFSGSGDWWITHEPTVGDYVVLVVSTRSLDLWLEKGGQQETGNADVMDINNAIAIHGVFTKDNTMDPPPNLGGIEIRKKDGSIFVRISDDGIRLVYNDTTVDVTDGLVSVDPGIIPGATDVQVQVIADGLGIPGMISLASHTHVSAAPASPTSLPLITPPVP